MSRIDLLAEGQTEETFVRELLQPHYARMGLFLTPILVSTSPEHKGGVVSYAKIKPQITRLCKQDAGAHVTTMFDLYALPGDFPGKSDPARPHQGSGHQKAAFLEAQLAQNIRQQNFVPNIMVHEYEALLFAQPERFADWTDRKAVDALTAIRQTHAPEDINDDPHTAPSKRILAVMPGYQKTFHGPLLVCEIGLDAMRKDCPHFDAWLRWLEALIQE
ncbi:MAG: DUF4276 family protein [Burkholderiaceae bacterium]|nr:DUF4276 family protein [Burkholderiaceae bacterium]